MKASDLRSKTEDELRKELTELSHATVAGLTQAARGEARLVLEGFAVGLSARPPRPGLIGELAAALAAEPASPLRPALGMALDYANLRNVELGEFHPSPKGDQDFRAVVKVGYGQGDHGRIQVAYSRDGGSSWSITTPHETADQLSVDRWHQWLGVGPDGTVYVAYYDTRRDPSRTSVDFYYSFSTDGAQTWSPPDRLTTVISPNIADGFEFGDYNGLDIVMNQLMTVFTDNRSESGGTGDSIDIYGVGLDTGTSADCGNCTIEPGEAVSFDADSVLEMEQWSYRIFERDNEKTQ